MIHNTTKAILRTLAFALALCATTSAWAITADAVWEGGFTDNSTITGASGITYTLVLNGNTSDTTGDTLPISANLGAKISLSSSSANLAVLVKYSALNAAPTKTYELAAIRVKGKGWPGLRVASANGYGITGFYEANSSNDYGFSITPKLSSTGGYFLLCHQGGSQTGGYAGSTLQQLSGGTTTSLKWGTAGTTLDTIVLGGPSQAGQATSAYTGLVIEKVAIFNQVVTGADLATYAFPSEDPATTYDYTATISANTTFSDITWTTGTGTPGTDAKVYIEAQNNAVLTIGGTFDVGTLWVNGGSIAFDTGTTVSSTKIVGAPINIATETVNFSDSFLASAINTTGACTINFTDCEIYGGITAAQNGDATINTYGNVVFGDIADNYFKYRTTFCVKSGSTTTYNSKSDMRLWCTVRVEKNATLINERKDSFDYNSNASYPIHAYIYGTLTLNQKWTVGKCARYIHLYDRALINGSAGNALHSNISGYACDFIAEEGTSTITAPFVKGEGTINVVTKENAMLVLSTSQDLAKSGAGTLRIKNTHLVNNISGSEGVLELYNDSGENKTHYNTISFAGTIKATRENSSNSHNAFGSSTEDTATTGQDLILTGMPKLEVAGSHAYLCLNAQLANQNLSVKNLTYEGDVSDAKVDPVFNGGTSTGNMAQIKTIKTKQTENTICNLIFSGEANSGKRQSGLYVYGDTDAVHSLTLTKESTTFGPLTVENYGKVIFSDSGKWANGTVTVGVNGVLEAQHTAALGVVTLQDGATIVVPTVSSAVVPLTGTTVTLPTSGTVNVDLTGVTVAEGESVTVISATSLVNAKASIFRQTEGGWRFSVDNNTIKARKLGTATWSDGTWSDSDLTGYASASITASGTQDVTLPATTSFDTLTITGSGTVTLTSTSSETCTVAALSIGAGVTLNASSSLVLAEGCAITGEGVLNIPANTTFAMNGVTCSTVSISGTGAISVPESTICSMEDVSLTGTTISGEGIISVPASTTCSMTDVTCSAKIIVAGTLATSGTTTLSGENKSTGTINVTGGVTTATFRGQYLEGTVNIASGAELVLPSSNPIFYNSPSSINIVVKGTLTVNNTMTIGTNTPISLYPGAIVRGSGTLSLGGNEKKASTIQMNAQGGDTSGIATISCGISTSAHSSGAKIIVEEGVTLACSGTMSGANSIAKQGQGSLTIDAGTMVSTVQPTGQVTINENATFELKDCAWTSNVFSGSGTLYLHHTNTSTDRYNHSVSGSSFSGRLKIGTPSGKKAYFNDNPETQLTGRPELVLELGTQGEQGQLWVGAKAKDKYFKVKNLSGWGYVVPWSSEKGVHYFETVQNANTEFSGVFADWNGSAIGTGDYKTGLTVKGGDTVKSLTLTAANTTTGPLAIQDSGKVIFSGSGSWLNGTTTVKANGVLESQRDAQVVGNLTLEDGSTLSFAEGYSLNVGAITLPASGTVTLDISKLTLSDSGTTLMTFSTAPYASDVVNMMTVSGAALKLENSTLKAYPIAATLTKNDDTVVPFATVQDAVNATINPLYDGYKYITVNVDDTTVNAVDMTLKIKYGAGVSSLTVNSPSEEYASDGGITDGESGITTYSLAPAAKIYTWSATGEGVKHWTSPLNWTYGSGTLATRCPTDIDSVVFNSGASVSCSAASVSCAGMTIEGNVTLAGANGKDINLGGNITGSGVLTLDNACLKNSLAEAITVADTVEVLFTEDSEIAASQSVGITFNGPVSISGTIKAWDAVHTVAGTTTLSGNFTKSGGDFELTLGNVVVSASTTPTISAGTLAINGAVTVSDGATFTIPPSGLTVGDSASFVLVGRSSVLVDNGSGASGKVSTSMTDGARVVSTTAAGVTTYKVGYGTIFSVY